MTIQKKKFGNTTPRVIFDGQVAFYRRYSYKTGEPMGIWQTRFRFPKRAEFPDDPKYIRKSTGFKNEADAEAWARDEYFRIRSRWENGLPLKPQNFKSVFWDYYREQKDLYEAEEISAEKISKILATFENHLQEFFGEYSITDIDEQLINKYLAERVRSRGIRGVAQHSHHRPSADTVNRENSVLRGMLELAHRKRYIVRLPSVRFLPRRNDKRQHFTDEEWQFIVKQLEEDIQRYKDDYRDLAYAREVYKYRMMLKTLVQLIGYSGVRPGRESNQNIRWRDVRVAIMDENNIVRHPVSGIKDETYKTDQISHVEIFVSHVKWHTLPDPRTAISLAWVESALRRWRSETDFPEEDDFIFCHQNSSRNLPRNGGHGSPIHSFSHQFKDFLRTHELLIDSNGKNRTLTSCRHTYATQRLLHSEMSIYELSRCMGTSIKMIEKIYGHVVPTDFAGRAAKLPAGMDRGSNLPSLNG